MMKHNMQNSFDQGPIFHTIFFRGKSNSVDFIPEFSGGNVQNNQEFLPIFFTKRQSAYVCEGLP
jgi:hypothetical protein